MPSRRAGRPQRIADSETRIATLPSLRGPHAPARLRQSLMTGADTQLLAELLAFVRDEQAVNDRRRLEIWERPLREKLESGWTQPFSRLEPTESPDVLCAYVTDGESRFREGDLLVLHGGDPSDAPLARQLRFETDAGDHWLLRGPHVAAVLRAQQHGTCYADPDAMDLTPYYEQAIRDIGESPIGERVVLPLLTGTLHSSIIPAEQDAAEREACLLGFNLRQAHAIGLGFAADPVACIQGPPGTGKTRVLAHVVRKLVARGARVLVTSHTHMAIHNALNAIQEPGIVTVKIGADHRRVGLDASIPSCPSFGEWSTRPEDGVAGYVVGATPFATCTSRLKDIEFDVVVFDESSQITVPLALMAMRTGRRYIFVGDQKQLPPVTVSRSVLSRDALSVFARLTSLHAFHTVMLNETYRMNQWLTSWPSRAYYNGELTAVGTNHDRRLSIRRVEGRLAAALAPDASGVFIPTLDRAARTLNTRDAELVVDLCASAIDAGLAASCVGVITPYRAQGRAIRTLLAKRLSAPAARDIVADTVERMQGQERELVIVSLATGDAAFLSRVAEFFFQPERLNVSITRARTKLIVIGPPPESLPRPDDPAIRPWVAQYADLINHLTRVDV